MLASCKALGDIDTATAPSFNAELHDVIDNADEAFVNVDCSGLTFIDPAGYHALVDATNYAIRRGHTLVIRNLSPSCAMLLSLFDEDRELHIEPCRHSIHRPEIGGCASARLVSTTSTPFPGEHPSPCGRAAIAQPGVTLPIGTP